MARGGAMARGALARGAMAGPTRLGGPAGIVAAAGRLAAAGLLAVGGMAGGRSADGHSLEPHPRLYPKPLTGLPRPHQDLRNSGGASSTSDRSSSNLVSPSSARTPTVKARHAAR
jgi:hypothetical protein